MLVSCAVPVLLKPFPYTFFTGGVVVSPCTNRLRGKMDQYQGRAVTVLCGGLATIYALAGVTKIVGTPAERASYRRAGFPAWALAPLGLVEACAIPAMLLSAPSQAQPQPHTC